MRSKVEEYQELYQKFRKYYKKKIWNQSERVDVEREIEEISLEEQKIDFNNIDIVKGYAMNPEEHGYVGTPEEIVEILKNEWIKAHPLGRGWWGYCVSAKGLKHVHMVLENSTAMRFSAVKKVYSKGNPHLESTKGTRKQVLAYITKKPPFDEKGEAVIAFCSHGNIEGLKKYSLRNLQETLTTIEQLIDEGKTPRQIMEEDIRLRREENLIRRCYMAKVYKETPPLREVKVIWHVGESGTSKSYSYVRLCEKFGEESVFFLQ